MNSKEQFEEKIDLLKNDYPAVYIAYCQDFRLDKQLNSYVAECMMRVNDPLKYSQYIHGGVLPTLDKMRKEGKLKRGKCLLGLIKIL